MATTTDFFQITKAQANRYLTALAASNAGPATSFKTALNELVALCDAAQASGAIRRGMDACLTKIDTIRTRYLNLSAGDKTTTRGL